MRCLVAAARKETKKLHILESLLALALILSLTLQPAYSVLSVYFEGSDIQFTVLNGGSFAFGNEDVGVTVSVTSGILNGTITTMTYWRNKGQINFIAEGTPEFTLTGFGDNVNTRYSGSIVQQYNSTLIDGSCINGDSFFFGWEVKTEPLLPIMFILGMVGVFTFFGGLLYAAVKIRDGEYEEGIRKALIFCSLGFGLIWGWLNL